MENENRPKEGERLQLSQVGEIVLEPKRWPFIQFKGVKYFKLFSKGLSVSKLVVCIGSLTYCFFRQNRKFDDCAANLKK